MKLDDYQYELQKLTESIEVQGDRYEFNIIGLAEEAGELMGKLKRALRGEGFNRTSYLTELGDVLGYLSLAAAARGIPFSNLVEHLSGQSPESQTIFSHSRALYVSVAALQIHLDEDNSRVTWKMSNLLFFIINCAEALESSLDEVMELNLAKLRDRLERNGTLLGTGDYR